MRAYIDTNVLMSENGEEIFNQYESVLTHITTLEELDNINHNSENETKKYNARKALKLVEKYINDKLEVILKQGTYSIPDLDKNKNDHKILSIAKDLTDANKDVIFVTADLNLILKAKSIEIPCIKWNDTTKFEVYNGWRIIDLTENELANWYESEIKANTWNLLINEYVLFRVNGDIVDKYKWTEDGFLKVKIPNIKGIKPLNDLQQCAFELMNSDTPIKIILGLAGSGKTMINIRFALNSIEKGKFQRIMYLRNPVGKGKAVGFLPGSKFEKLEPFCSPIIDNLDGGELQFQQLISQDKLQIECTYFIKGASKESTWFCIDEGEDLDKETLKLIGTRLAKNSVMCISADLDQTEKEYRANNGLREFVDKFKGNALVGVVVLTDDVRSEVSKLFGSF